MTFMNNSGLSVKGLSARQGIALEDILVICDDLSFSFGKMRLRPSGGAGGHNGLKSIIGHLGQINLPVCGWGSAPSRRETTVIMF